MGELWRSWGENDATYTDDYSPVVDFLNSDDFRSFGDGLSEIIQSKIKSLKP